mgnify:FL=1
MSREKERDVKRKRRRENARERCVKGATVFEEIFKRVKDLSSQHKWK